MSFNIKKLVPDQRYTNGKYTLKNPEKYIGDPYAIIYRSSYERAFCVFCDESPTILKWASEPFSIPYFSPIDQRQHTYFIDFYIRVLDENGNIKDMLIEIKPAQKLKKPKQPKRKTKKSLKNFDYSAKEFVVNLAKFQAAKTYAENIGYHFSIITEENLFSK